MKFTACQSALGCLLRPKTMSYMCGAQPLLPAFTLTDPAIFALRGFRRRLTVAANTACPEIRAKCSTRRSEYQVRFDTQDFPTCCMETIALSNVFVLTYCQSLAHISAYNYTNSRISDWQDTYILRRQIWFAKETIGLWPFVITNIPSSNLFRVSKACINMY